jgi:hypothetical protein
LAQYSLYAGSLKQSFTILASRAGYCKYKKLLKDITMKKTLLACVLTGLFSIGAAVANDQQTVEVVIDTQADSPLMIKIQTDDNNQVFEFTSEEIKDMDAVEARLANVDEKTRTMVLDALKGFSGDHHHHNMMKLHHMSHSDGEDNQFVMVKHFDSQTDENSEIERHIVIKGSPGENGMALHNVMKHADGNHMVIKMDHDGQMLTMTLRTR